MDSDSIPERYYYFFNIKSITSIFKFRSVFHCIVKNMTNLNILNSVKKKVNRAIAITASESGGSL